jgi:hypothetical protein
MRVDRAAFRKLVAVHVNPKTRVTCVTRVAANRINGLAGHSASAACVTCVTEAPVKALSHKLRDHCEQECVTGKIDKEERLTYSSHAVTRSRTKIVGEKKGLVDGSPEAAVLADWLACYEERAAIREYEGGFARGEAERLSLDETVSMFGPKPEAEVP